MKYVRAFKAFEPETTKIVTRVPVFTGLPFPTGMSPDVIDLPITWVRTTRVDVVIAIGDRPLKKVIDLGDQISELDVTTVGRAVGSAKRTVEDWNISIASDVEVCVRAWIVDRPTLGPVSPANLPDQNNFYSLSNLSGPAILWREGLNVSTAPYTEMPIMEETHSLAKLWSNRWSEGETTDAAWQDFIMRVNEVERTTGEPVSYWMAEAS
jgi:hypothetical protein